MLIVPVGPITPRPIHLSKSAIEAIAARHAASACAVPAMVDHRYAVPTLKPGAAAVVAASAERQAARVHSGPRVLNAKQRGYYVRAYLATFAQLAAGQE